MTVRGPSEEAIAAARVVLGMTLAVGGMAAAIGASAGTPLVLLAIPTGAAAAALLLRAVRVAAWAAAAVWVLLAPHASGEALVAPVVMASLCLAIAVGPDRLLGWVGRDAVGIAPDATGSAGWIEEDGRPVD
jgi:hypothetical protein